MANSQLHLPPCHVLTSDTGARMAKATVRKADEFYPKLGACMEEVRHTCRLTLEEFAAALGKDSRQVARQIKGDDRPQIEVVLAHERFCEPMLIALAGLSQRIEVQTVLTVRRTA